MCTLLDLDHFRKTPAFVLVGTIHEKEDGPAKGIVYAGYNLFDVVAAVVVDVVFVLPCVIW